MSTAAIWCRPLDLAELQGYLAARPQLASHLGIQFVELGPDYLKARMPVDDRTRQPFGLLHGGASCVLAETLGSFASVLVADPDRAHVVGLEINANHIRAMSEGAVIGTARPLHLGRSTHVWDIRIESEARGALVCVSRLTVAVMPKRD